jgi:hypothetical protein
VGVARVLKLGTYVKRGGGDGVWVRQSAIGECKKIIDSPTLRIGMRQ